MTTPTAARVGLRIRRVGMGKKPTHFDLCQDQNCERKWCVDRRNADCTKTDDHLVEGKVGSKLNRCVYCHAKFFCSGYGWCDLHGEHGP